MTPVDRCRQDRARISIRRRVLADPTSRGAEVRLTWTRSRVPSSAAESRTARPDGGRRWTSGALDTRTRSLRQPAGARGSAVLRAISTGRCVPRTRDTFDDWAERWLARKEASGVRPSTMAGYRSDLKHLREAFGRYRRSGRWPVAAPTRPLSGRPRRRAGPARRPGRVRRGRRPAAPRWPRPSVRGGAAGRARPVRRWRVGASGPGPGTRSWWVGRPGRRPRPRRRRGRRPQPDASVRDSGAAVPGVEVPADLLVVLCLRTEDRVDLVDLDRRAAVQIRDRAEHRCRGGVDGVHRMTHPRPDHLQRPGLVRPWLRGQQRQPGCGVELLDQAGAPPTALRPPGRARWARPEPVREPGHRIQRLSRGQPELGQRPPCRTRLGVGRARGWPRSAVHAHRVAAPTSPHVARSVGRTTTAGSHPPTASRAGLVVSAGLRSRLRRRPSPRGPRQPARGSPHR